MPNEVQRQPEVHVKASHGAGNESPPKTRPAMNYVTPFAAARGTA